MSDRETAENDAPQSGCTYAGILGWRHVWTVTDDKCVWCGALRITPPGGPSA